MARDALAEQTELGPRSNLMAVRVGLPTSPDREAIEFVVVDKRDLDIPAKDPLYQFALPQQFGGGQVSDPIFKGSLELIRWAVKMISGDVAKKYAPHLYCEGLRLLRGHPGKGEAYSQMMTTVLAKQTVGKFGPTAPESERRLLKDRQVIKRGAVSLSPHGREGWTFDAHRMSIRLALEFAALVLRDLLTKETDDRYYIEWLVVLGPQAWLNDELDPELPRTILPAEVARKAAEIRDRKSAPPRSASPGAATLKSNGATGSSAASNEDGQLAFFVEQILGLTLAGNGTGKPWGEILPLVRSALEMLQSRLKGAGVTAEGAALSAKQTAALTESIRQRAEVEIFAPREQSLAQKAADFERHMGEAHARVNAERAALDKDRAALAEEKRALNGKQTEFTEFEAAFTTELSAKEAALQAREAALAAAEARLAQDRRFVELGKLAAAAVQGGVPSSLPSVATPAPAAVSIPASSPTTAAYPKATVVTVEAQPPEAAAPGNGVTAAVATDSPPAPPQSRQAKFTGWRAQMVGGKTPTVPAAAAS